MSDARLPVVGIVAEGPTDVSVLRAVIEAVVGAEVEARLLQPEACDTYGNFGDRGPGWKGVRAWCTQMRDEFGAVANFLGPGYGNEIDLLVVHIDADVASDSEIGCERPCPPAESTVEALDEIVLRWLGLAQRIPSLVLAVPSRSMEAWVLAALASIEGVASPCSECNRNPKGFFDRNPWKKYTRTPQRRQRAKQECWEELATLVAREWPAVRKLKLADRFEEHVRSGLVNREGASP